MKWLGTAVTFLLIFAKSFEEQNPFDYIRNPFEEPDSREDEEPDYEEIDDKIMPFDDYTTTTPFEVENSTDSNVTSEFDMLFNATVDETFAEAANITAELQGMNGTAVELTPTEEPLATIVAKDNEFRVVYNRQGKTVLKLLHPTDNGSDVISQQMTERHHRIGHWNNVNQLQFDGELIDRLVTNFSVLIDDNNDTLLLLNTNETSSGVFWPLIAQQYSSLTPTVLLILAIVVLVLLLLSVIMLLMICKKLRQLNQALNLVASEQRKMVLEREKSKKAKEEMMKIDPGKYQLPHLDSLEPPDDEAPPEKKGFWAALVDKIKSWFD